MSRNERSGARALIHLCYCLPAILGLLLLLYAVIPHLWFVYDGDAYSTMNLFDLQGNAWDFYEQIVAEEIEESEATRWFSQLLPVVSALFWILPIWYGVLSLFIAVSAVVAFSFEPTSRTANRTKRILQLACPNRICYILLPLLPLFSALFPQLLLWFYRLQGLKMTLHTEFLQDWVMVLLVTLINAAVFIALLPMQNSMRMDLFRIYKRRSNAVKDEE